MAKKEFKRARVRRLLLAGMSPNEVSKTVPCSRGYVYSVRQDMELESADSSPPPPSPPLIPVSPVLHVDALWAGIKTRVLALWVRLTTFK